MVLHSARAMPSISAAARPELELANPISSEMSVMRPSLLAGPDRRGPSERQSRLQRHRPVRGRPDLSRRQAGGSAHRRLRSSPRHGEADRRRPALGWRRQARRSVRRQGRCAGAACRARPRCGKAADRTRRAGLVSSRALRSDPSRAEERARLFRRIAPQSD